MSSKAQIEEIQLKLKITLSIVIAAMLAAAPMLVHSSSAQSVPRRIEVTAKRFDFTPGDITLNKHEAVVLVLKSADVPHGVRFKEPSGASGTSGSNARSDDEIWSILL